MAYVGIDQSLSGFGLVIINASSGEHFAHLGKFDRSKFVNDIDRLLYIEEWLHQYLVGWDLDEVCMEGYANGAKFGREKAGELGHTVKRYLRVQHPQEFLPKVVPPTSVKKFATGNGSAKKNEMLLAVYKRWGVEFKDDNLADAFVLAKIADALANPDTRELTKYQEDALAKVTF